MDWISVFYLLSTLFVVSFFNLLILRKISGIECLYKTTIQGMDTRLKAVEASLSGWKNGSVGSPQPTDSQVDANQ